MPIKNTENTIQTGDAFTNASNDAFKSSFIVKYITNIPNDKINTILKIYFY